MAISLKILSNLDKVTANFYPGCERAIVKATRSTMTKMLTTLRSDANKAARTKVALKAGEINKEWFDTSKIFRGSKFRDLDKFIAVLHVRNKAISFIKLVRGSRAPMNQKGVSIGRRKQLRVELKKGKVSKFKDLFIARANGGVYHVFRRVPPSRGKGTKSVMKKQSLPSLHYLFLDLSFVRPIEQQVGKKMQELFIKQLDYELRKETSKV